MNVLLPEYKRVEPVSIGLWSYRSGKEQGASVEGKDKTKVIGDQLSSDQ